MSSRKPGYLIGVIVVALVMSAPQFALVILFCWEWQQRGSLPLPPGLGPTQAYSSMEGTATFWNDKFIFNYPTISWPNANRVIKWRIAASDPETGAMSLLDLTVPRPNVHLMNFGHRLWLVDPTAMNGESFEIVDDQVQPSDFMLPGTWLSEGARFLLDGEPAYVRNQGVLIVSTFQAGTWGNDRELVFPGPGRKSTKGLESMISVSGAQVACFNNGDRVHFFLCFDGGLLFHHEGIELKPLTTKDGTRGLQTGMQGEFSNAPVSALSPANDETATIKWTPVREQRSHHHCEGLVRGEPAVLIVDQVRSGNPVGSLFRLDGTGWIKVASQSFPFGSDKFRMVTCRDKRKSYIVATTSTGMAHVYAWGETGVRATHGGATSVNNVLQSWLQLRSFPIATLVLGVLLGVWTWFLMWWYTRRDYGFGNQKVKLASLGRRGMARLIDLVLIVGTTAGLGWTMTLNVDWNAFFEALNLKLDHPSIPMAKRAASILVLWNITSIASLLILQGKWGITPGKWCCGLRTLRTTLRPCGFARSLVRETVLCVDACSFLCWTPGILSIAFTDCRQRLGDLAAETVVIEVRSLLPDKSSISAD